MSDASVVRTQVSAVRALLDELDRAVPSPDAGDALDAGGRVVEELKQLGHRILECAHKLDPSGPPSNGR